MVAFVLFSAVVYLLPRNRINEEVDTILQALTSELHPTAETAVSDGTIRIAIDEDLRNLETATSFYMVVDTRGGIISHSQNMDILSSDFGLLDENGLQDKEVLNNVIRDDSTMRVLTTPIYKDGDLLGHLQVGRLVDNILSFNRFLVIALFVGFAGASASLFLAVMLTPSSFKPLEDLAASIRQISNSDNFYLRVPDTERTDEIGVLARSFNNTLRRLYELNEIDKVKNDFIMIASHELRTPLTPVKSCIENMLSGMYGPLTDKQEARLNAALVSIQAETQLIENILDLARIQQNNAIFDPAKEDILKIVKDIASIFEYDARQKNISLETKLPNIELLLIEMDSNQIKQILVNLVKNAIKFTPIGGFVKIVVQDNKRFIEIIIEDSGIGIPESELGRIFERFYQVDSTLTRKVGGTGIGLNLVAEYVKMHGGEIHVSSKLGQGSIFSVSLLKNLIRETSR